jgi:hypothetical protein
MASTTEAKWAHYSSRGEDCSILSARPIIMWPFHPPSEPLGAPKQQLNGLLISPSGAPVVAHTPARRRRPRSGLRQLGHPRLLSGSTTSRPSEAAELGRLARARAGMRRAVGRFRPHREHRRNGELATRRLHECARVGIMGLCRGTENCRRSRVREPDAGKQR